MGPVTRATLALVCTLAIACQALGANTVGDTSAQFADFLKQDYERWARVIQAAGVKPE